MAKYTFTEFFYTPHITLRPSELLTETLQHDEVRLLHPKENTLLSRFCMPYWLTVWEAPNQSISDDILAKELNAFARASLMAY
jgi:hypothetical protein